MEQDNADKELTSPHLTDIKHIKALVQETIMDDMRWYRKYSYHAGLAHRISGTMIIALSASLPLFASLEFQFKNLVISVIGILIAFLSGLHSFFRWDEIWKTNMRGMVTLKNKVVEWKLRMLEAECDSQEGFKKAIRATEDLLNLLKEVDTQNAEDHIQNINSPVKRS
jgi:hypothetical protein